MVLDEADLLLSYGYEDDLQALAPHVPRSTQCMLMSATSSAAVEALTALVLHNPTVLNLLTQAGGRVFGDGGSGGQQQTAAGCSEEHAAAEGVGGSGSGGQPDFATGGAGSAAEISHAMFECAQDDRRLALLALLKLGLLRRKVLIFVNDVEGGVGLRLFLESFGLRLGCLHAELPVNSRSHMLAAFNRGLFDYLIAVGATGLHLVRCLIAFAGAVVPVSTKAKRCCGHVQQHLPPPAQLTMPPNFL